MTGLLIGAIAVVVVILVLVIYYVFYRQPDWKCVKTGNEWNILRRMDGTIQCMTSDGKSCFNFADEAACKTKLSAPGTTGAPYACTTGADDPTSWCYKNRTDI